MKYIEIEKDKIPYTFDLVVDGIVYTLTIRYNTTFDYFTFDLHIKDRVIAVGQKIVYGLPSFNTLIYRDVPPIGIIPWDMSEKSFRCGYDELEETVFLWVDDSLDNEGEEVIS